MKQKLYLVLSVAEVVKLSRAVRRSSRARKGKVVSKHCIVLDLETAPGNRSGDGAEQICSVSFHQSIAEENKYSDLSV